MDPNPFGNNPLLMSMLLAMMGGGANTGTLPTLQPAQNAFDQFALFQQVQQLQQLQQAQHQMMLMLSGGLTTGMLMPPFSPLVAHASSVSLPTSAQDSTSVIALGSTATHEANAVSLTQSGSHRETEAQIFKASADNAASLPLAVSEEKDLDEETPLIAIGTKRMVRDGFGSEAMCGPNETRTEAFSKRGRAEGSSAAGKVVSVSSSPAQAADARNDSEWSFAILSKLQCEHTPEDFRAVLSTHHSLLTRLRKECAGGPITAEKSQLTVKALGSMRSSPLFEFIIKAMTSEERDACLIFAKLSRLYQMEVRQSPDVNPSVAPTAYSGQPLLPIEGVACPPNCALFSLVEAWEYTNGPLFSTIIGRQPAIKQPSSSSTKASNSYSYTIQDRVVYTRVRLNDAPRFADLSNFEIDMVMVSPLPAVNKIGADVMHELDRLLNWVFKHKKEHLIIDKDYKLSSICPPTIKQPPSLQLIQLANRLSMEEKRDVVELNLKRQSIKRLVAEQKRNQSVGSRTKESVAVMHKVRGHDTETGEQQRDRAAEMLRRVLIANVPSDIRLSDISLACSAYGTVADLHWFQEVNCIVTMSTSEEARALELLSGKLRVKNSPPLQVEKFNDPKPFRSL